MAKNKVEQIAINIMSTPYIRRIVQFVCLNILAPLLRFTSMGNRQRRSVLFVGHCYYNSWYASRGLRKKGWVADVYNWDLNEDNQKYYHGEDYRIKYPESEKLTSYIKFYLWALRKYDIFHFSNKDGMQFGYPLYNVFKNNLNPGLEIRFLKSLGKKIVYTNNGCLDGVSQTEFRKWGPYPVCDICRWRRVPNVCSDEKNLAWGAFRNEMADYQCLLGGNRVDYNKASTVHEVPEFYCLDSEIWNPNLEIPEAYRYNYPEDTVLLYHSVGNYTTRTDDSGVNIKSTHIYKPLVDRLSQEGYKLELVFCTNTPNKEVRFYQAQTDIFLEMLTYGWFGANAREAMMLGKPVICYLRPEWLESVRSEIPDYVDELPIVNANPDNIYEVLLDLITNKEKRLEIGRRSREFAVKWHSSEAAGRRLDSIYMDLLRNKN